MDPSPFKDMARRSECAETRNRLFLIDRQLVFWDRAGLCADAAYSETLYGGAIADTLCDLHDSIAGPIESCPDERYRQTFETIIANLDKPDLGLGSGNSVEPLLF